MDNQIKVNMYLAGQRTPGHGRERLDFDSWESMTQYADSFAAEARGKVFVYEVEDSADVVYVAAQ